MIRKKMSKKELKAKETKVIKKKELAKNAPAKKKVSRVSVQKKSVVKKKTTGSVPKKARASKKTQSVAPLITPEQARQVASLKSTEKQKQVSSVAHTSRISSAAGEADVLHERKQKQSAQVSDSPHGDKQKEKKAEPIAVEQKEAPVVEDQIKRIPLEVEAPISVKDLSVKLQEKPSSLIKYLIEKQKMFVTINQSLEEEIVIKTLRDFGFEYKKKKSQEDILLDEHIVADNVPLRSHPRGNNVYGPR